MRRAGVFRALTVIACVALVGCSDGGDGDGDAAGTSTLVETTVSSPSEPSSTVPETTSTTLSQRQQDEAEIRALHQAFGELIEDYESDDLDARLERTYVDPLLQRTRELLLGARAQELELFGDYQSEIVSIEFRTDDEAVVVFCSIDGIGARRPDGTLEANPDTEAFHRSFVAVRVAKGWRIQESFEPENSCDLSS